ncbi:uncharacterized protein DUF2000 [Glaciihabitans tibetensis]|uniref:Uncharacterized protein DUF2000 n=1 Tax=Glaciihabitans tibetensis TaxID=1266600 RepID=A0A2T0V2D6_9MICO|nr:DUF2000 domain-containing protein [Glaciihabitans tibetensis]PRY64324.1 uncharacterized protein DUF2000 [Glaciihabitans tibetensis]
MSDVVAAAIGFDPEEIDTAMSTRAARLKWVIVVNDSIPAGRAVNAAICAAGATVAGVGGLLGPGATDGEGTWHPGLPWVGCSILVADSTTLRAIRAKGEAHEGTFVADMPSAAQETRVYDDYVNALGSSDSDGIEYLAVSLVGPKNRIDKIVGRLPLMP